MAVLISGVAQGGTNGLFIGGVESEVAGGGGGIMLGGPRYLWPVTVAGGVDGDPTVEWTAATSVLGVLPKVMKQIQISLPTGLTSIFSWELLLTWRTQVTGGNLDTGGAGWAIVPDGSQVNEGDTATIDYVTLSDLVPSSGVLTDHARSASVLLSEMTSDFHLALVGSADHAGDTIAAWVGADSRIWGSVV